MSKAVRFVSFFAIVLTMTYQFTMAGALSAQTAAPGPDTMVLASGERLTGHLQDAAAGKVDFASDGVGKVSIEWSKIQELHSTAKFAVIRKNEKLAKNVSVNTIPQGTIDLAGQNITVTPANGGSPQTIPVAEVGFIVAQQAFLNAVQHNPGFLHDWTGTASFGAALVEATQNSTSITSGIGLVREIPSESWLDPRNRTLADFTSTYGRISQPATPTVKTSIFHADAERDEYLNGSIFALGDAAFDHDFSQGLDLQQIYGGGLGWTVVKNANQALNLQGSVTYERQSFVLASQDKNLIGSVFSEDYDRKFKNGMVLTQKLLVNPAWNIPSAYSGNASVALAFPLYKKFSISTTAADAFLDDPPPGFKKNSFQFATALTYTFAAK